MTRVMLATIMAVWLNRAEANTGTETFTSSTVWLCPAGVTSVQVECWGGGGAGGSAVRPSGSGTLTGGGGAGGAYVKLNTLAVTPGTLYTVTVGAGGVSSTANGATVAGGDSWFGSSATVLAKGGAGGTSVSGSASANGAGGTGSTTGCIGDVKNAGGSGIQSTSGNFGGGGGGSGGTAGPGNAPASSTTGVGGIAVTGGGPGGNANATSASSGPGQTPTTGPGGGGGGARSASTTQQIGGTGAPGQVVITYTIPSSVVRANTSGNLNTTGDWVGGVVPGPQDFAVWDSTVSTAANCTNALGGNLTWRGLSIGSPAAAVNITAGNTLTLGGFNLQNNVYGIDMSGASQNLTLGCGVTIGTGAQSWNVAAGRTLDASGITVARTQGGTLDFTGTGSTKVGNSLVNGIIGGWATVNGADWAATSSSTVIPLATYVLLSAQAANTDNIDVTSSTGTSIPGASSIRFKDLATARALTINSAGSPYAISSGGVLVKSGVTGSIIGSSTSGGLRELRGSSGGDLILIVGPNGPANLTIGASAGVNGPITISDNGTPTGLTKSGLGTVTFYGQGTYTGNTRINQGTLALASYNNGTQTSLSGSTNIFIESGATLDVVANTNASFVNAFNMAGNQRVEGLGTINGNLVVSNNANSVLNAGSHGANPTYGSLTLRSNLTIGSLSKVIFDLSSNNVSGNSKIVMDAATGTLNANGATITINQVNGNNTLTNGDYVLCDLTGASGNVASSFAASPAWTSTPANALNYTVVTLGKQVVLHYTAPPSAANSTATASPSAGVASDGVATSTITVTARDGSGNVISNAFVSASATGTGNTLSTPALTGANGQSTFTIKSSVAETKTITVTIAGTTITQQPTVTFVPGAVNPTNSTAVASPTTGVTADGSATSTITVTAKDVNGNNISGASVTATATGSGNSLSTPAATDSSGQTTFTIASTVAGSKTITVSINGVQITNQPTVNFIPGPVSASASTAVASPTTVSSDGVSISTITVTARDANNNLITNATVSASSDGSGNTLSTPANTDANGQTTFTIASTVAEVKTITVVINGTTITQQPQVTFQVSVSPSLSTVSASPTNGIVADNSATSTITVTAIDVGANPIVGATVAITSSGTGNTISTPAPTDGSGVTTATIRTTKAETKTISVTVNGTPITQQAVVTFVPGSVSATNSTLSPATATKVADGSSTQIVTVQARDVFNNVRTSGGDTVVFSATAGSVGSTTDNGDGTYSVTWTSPTSIGSGTATVTATLNSANVGTAVGASSSIITLTAAPASQVRIETAANGTGTVLGATNFDSGASVTGYAIFRDANDNFVTNGVPDSWSLVNVTGGVAAGDLVTNANGKSAVFSAHLAGSANIRAVSGSLTSVDSGTITVVQPFYKSAGNGNWNSAATWQRADTINATYTAATFTPNSTNTAGVTVQSPHNVTNSATVTVDKVTVAAGATLTVNATMNVAQGGGTDLDVFGTVVNSSTIGTTANPVILFEAAALYRHAQNSGTIPASTWNPTSTCEITGWTSSTAPTGTSGFGQTFGHFTWNNPGQTTTVNLNGFLTTIFGDFTIANTGGQILRGAGSGGVTMNIGGSLKVLNTGGASVYTLGNNNPTATTYNITNNIEVASGAILDFKEAGTSGGSYTVNLYGNLIVSGTGIVRKSNTATGAFNFLKNGTQIVAVDATATCGATAVGSATAIGWTVSSNTVLDLGTSVIVGGNSTFTTTPGSTLRIGSPGGISASGATGNIQTATRTFDGAGNYFYTGTNAQVTGTGLTTTTGNIQILNTNGVVTLTQSATVNSPGTFTVATGAFLQESNDNINGTGNFTLQDGGTLGIDNSNGLTISSTTTGMIRVSGTRTVSSSATFIYNGTVAQGVGGGLPSSSASVIIANTNAPVSLSSGTRTITNLTVNANATLDFASTTSASQTLTTVNPPVLNGTLIMEVNKTAPNTFTGSKLTQSSGILNYAGTLIVTNLGASLQTGDVIPVFASAGGFSGGFSSVTAPLAPAGLTRDVSQLTGGTGGNILYTCDGTLVANAAADTSICSGDSYSLNGSGANGSGGYSFSWSSTPAGFTSTLANPGVSPTATTTYHLIVTDSVGCTAGKDVVVTVNASSSISTASLPDGTIGAAYNETVTATGGATPYAFGATGLPAGLSINGVSGIISGTPTVAGSSSVTLLVTNATGCVASTTLSLNINKANSSIALNSGTSFTYDGTAKTPTFTFTGSGGAQSYSYTGGSYGPSANAPTNAGSYSVEVALAADANYNGATNTQAFTINPAAPSFALNSSALTNGFLDNVTFTATLPADAGGNIVFATTNGTFSTNTLVAGSATSLGIANLPRGFNLITAVYSGDGNYLSATNSLVQTVTNHAPVAAGASYTRNAAITSIHILVADLLTNVTDVDGDSITLVSAGGSTNGATVTVSGGQVNYLNTNAVADEFTYTVTDGFGGTNSALVHVSVDFTPLFGQTTIANVSAGTATLNFAGIPGYSYSVARSTDLTSWTVIFTTNAPAGGAFQFIDNSAPSPAAYYRLQSP